MTQAEVLRLLVILEGAYGREFTDKSRDVYSLMLADLPYKESQKAIINLIASSKFMPTVAEIRRATVEDGTGIPHAEIAWMEVRAAARDFSPYTESRHQWSHPVVKKAADVLGGVGAIGFSENIDYLANQFFRVYENLRETELVRMQRSGVEALNVRNVRLLKVVNDD